MPIYSFVDYTGNGSNVDYTIPFPYISAAHISVTVNSVLQVVVTNYTFTSPTTIRFVVAPPNTHPIRIRRVTPAGAPLVDFVDGVTVHDTDFDLMTLQTLYVTQEGKDATYENMITDPADGKWEGQAKVVKNILNGVAATDAATKGQIDALVGTVSSHSAAAASSAAAALLANLEAEVEATEAASEAAAAATSALESATAAGLVLSFIPGYIPIGGGMIWFTADLPAGWLLADGSSLLRVSYPALFGKYGTFFGADDADHFSIPDLRSKFPIGTGSVAGLTPRLLGTNGGAESHILTIAELPPHSHVIVDQGGGPSYSRPTSVGGTSLVDGDCAPTSVVGSGNNHPIMNPWFAVNFLIRAQ